MSEGSQTEQVDFVLSDMLCHTLEVHSKIRQPETKYLPDPLKAVGLEGSINCKLVDKIIWLVGCFGISLIARFCSVQGEELRFVFKFLPIKEAFEINLAPA